MKVRFEVLGPVRAIRDEGGSVPVGVVRRRLLAALLVRANRSVTTDMLAESLWGGGAAPCRPDRSLHVHVHRIRQVLDRGDRLVGVPGGYRLELEPDELDAEVFARTHEKARRTIDGGDPASAVVVFREALALWKGAPYADTDDPQLIGPEAGRLAEARLLAREELYDAELAVGRDREIVPELTELVSEFPLREKFAAQLMLALYRSGRQPRALATYQAVRRRLNETLNVRPGRELRELREAVRAEDPALLRRRTGQGAATAPAAPAVRAEPLVPSQLPPLPGAFSGREAELASLDREAGNPDGTALMLVTGMAGVGKTSLALRYAHSVAERFPDGRIYLDLRGHSPEPPLAPLEALERLIGGLGQDQGGVPGTVEEATARYRTLIADRKLLVLLDNAASEDQVRPLLPGTSGCRTLVTSRNRLSGLVAREGAFRMELGDLPVEDARVLLGRVIGGTRIGGEPDQIDDLIEACGRLPLALRIAAAQLADEPHRPVRDYLDEFRERGFTILELDDQHSAVEPAFDLSYQRLDAEARRVFRLLGTAPGADFTVQAASAMSHTTVSETRRLVRALVAAHLVEEHGPGRYRLHDLLREYARSRAEIEEPPEVRAEAMDRLCAWYDRAKRAAGTWLVPWRMDPGCTAAPDDVPETGFASANEATAWLVTEFDNIVATVRATGTGTRKRSLHWSWHLALGAVADMQRRGRGVEVLAILQVAADAARQARDPLAVTVTLAEQGLVRWKFGPVSDELVHEIISWAAATKDRSVHGYGCYVAGVIWERESKLDHAARYLERALSVQVDEGETTRQAMTLLHLGNVEYRRGDLRGAAEALGRLVELSDELPPAASAPALANLGHVLVTIGLQERASGLLDRAERILARMDDPCNNAVLAYTRGGWYRDTGRYSDAVRQLTLAREIADELELPWLRSHCRNELGFCQLALGDAAAARVEFERSVRLADSPRLRQHHSHAVRGLALCDLAESLLRAAESRAQDAIRLAESANRLHEAEALVALARIVLARDRPPEAIEHGERALAMHRASGHVIGQASAHRVLGEAHRAASGAVACAAGGPGRTHLDEALRMYRGFGSPEAQEVARLLREWA